MSRRGRLEQLRRELESWSGVPASARAFHRMRRTLGEDLGIESGRLLPWGGGDALVELEERADRLRPVAEGLRGLFEQRDVIEAQHVGLAARLESGQVAAPVAASELSRWRVELVRIGEGVRSTIDLEIEHRQLEELAASIGAAMARTPPSPESLPQDASPPVAAPAAPSARPTAPRSAPKSPVATELAPARAFEAASASLEAAAPRLSPPSAASPSVASPAGPSPVAGTDRVGTQVAAKEPGRTDRAAVHRLEELGQRLWEWATVVPAHSDAIAELSHRKEDAVARLEGGVPTGGSIASLLEASETLLGTITGSAAAERAARRRRLEERLRALARLVDHPDLEQRAAMLFADPVETARRHRSWLADLSELEGVLRDRLHNDHRRVDGAFDEAAGRLRHGLDGLGRQPLGEAVAAAVERLASVLGELEATTGVEARFDALGGLRELERELKICHEKAAAELARYADQERKLRDRARRLETLAGVLDTFTPALAVGELEQPADPDEPLEAAERALAEIDALVVAEEDRFVAACAAEHSRLAERDRALASVLDVAVLLRLLDTDTFDVDLLETNFPGTPRTASEHRGSVRDAASDEVASAGPSVAAESLAAARRRLAGLEKAFEQTVAAAAERLPAALVELEALGERLMRPGERQELAELVAEAGDASLSSASPFDRARLETCLGWLRRQSDLIDRVEGDRRRAAARHRRLISRLDSLERRRLAEACPQVLIERVHALVHGLDAHELGEAGAVHQLAVAEQLLARLETHANRLLVEALESARSRLAGDPSPAARAALAELDAAPADELPPPSLRRRLFHMARDEDTG